MRRLQLVCACAVLLLANAAAEQQKPAAQPLTDVTRAAWYNIKDLVLASATKVPEEHYAFQPTRDVRTFGQIVGHLANEHYLLCGAVTGRKAPDTDFAKVAAKADLLKALQESVAVCDMGYSLLSDDNAGFSYKVFGTTYSRLRLLTLNVTHDSEHYGNLVTYMRLKGIVPPSTASAR